MSPSKITPLQFSAQSWGRNGVLRNGGWNKACVFLYLSMLPWLSSRKLERGDVWDPAQKSHEFGIGFLWRPFPFGFSGVRQTEFRFAKLILALRHHPWINKSNERTKIVNYFTAFALKMFSSAWTFLAANTILWVISTTDNPDLPKKLRNRGTFISGLPWWHSCQRVCLQCRKNGFNPWVRKIPWRRKWQPTPGFLPENHMDRGA